MNLSSVHERRHPIRNFWFGLTLGALASGLAWALHVTGHDGRTFLLVMAALMLGKMLLAAAVAISRRSPGFARGLLVSLLIGAWVFGAASLNALKMT